MILCVLQNNWYKIIYIASDLASCMGCASCSIHSTQQRTSLVGDQFSNVQSWFCYLSAGGHAVNSSSVIDSPITLASVTFTAYWQSTHSLRDISLSNVRFRHYNHNNPAMGITWHPFSCIKMSPARKCEYLRALNHNVSQKKESCDSQRHQSIELWCTKQLILLYSHSSFPQPRCYKIMGVRRFLLIEAS